MRRGIQDGPKPKFELGWEDVAMVGVLLGLLFFMLGILTAPIPWFQKFLWLGAFIASVLFIGGTWWSLS